MSDCFEEISLIADIFKRRQGTRVCGRPLPSNISVFVQDRHQRLAIRTMLLLSLAEPKVSGSAAKMRLALQGTWMERPEPGGRFPIPPTAPAQQAPPPPSAET